MGKYTILKDPEIDKTIQQLLNTIVTEIKTILGNTMQAIILAGGYGRGEGGVYQDENHYQLVNDLDILVFVSGSLKRVKESCENSLEQLSLHLLTKGFGLKEIDIKLAHTSQYRFFSPKTVARYELLSGHQVLYGHLELDKLIPKIHSNQLPLYEGTNYFRNRGSGLLIPALYFLSDGLKEPDKRKNFQIELQKACQAIGDAYLLMVGQYHFSYQERLKRFMQLKRGALNLPENLFKRVCALYEWGMKKKLIPSFDWPGDQEIIDKWFTIREVFGEFFMCYESQRLGHIFKEWEDYAEHIMHIGAKEPWYLFVKSAVWILSSLVSKKTGPKSISYSPIQGSRKCLAVMPLLLFSLQHNLEVKESQLKFAAKIFGHTTSPANLTLWQNLVYEFLMTYYPTNVVKNALSLATINDNNRLTQIRKT